MTNKNNIFYLINYLIAPKVTWLYKKKHNKNTKDPFNSRFSNFFIKVTSLFYFIKKNEKY
jgi:hypothetical protein